MPLGDLQLALEGYDREERKGFPLSHVESIFVSFLPKKYELDGHRKILLEYVKNPSGRSSDYISLKPQIGSISCLEIDGFDSSEFLRLNYEEREKEAVRLIRDGLMKVAIRKGASIKPIEEAYEKTLESEFTISWKHAKTSKSRKDRKYRVDTVFTMDRKGTSVTLEFTHKKERIESVCIAEHEPWIGIWHEFWKAKWHEDEVSFTSQFDVEILRYRITEERKVEPVVPYNSGQSLRD